MTFARRTALGLAVMAGIADPHHLGAEAQGQRVGDSIRTRNAVFEVVSIKVAEPSAFPPGMEAGDPCSQAALRPIGNRLVGGSTTVYALIALAFNPWKLQCARVRASALITGGPDWIRSERYAIEALLPEGVPPPSVERLLAGDAPEVQAMLAQMLADRFKLQVQRRTRQTQAYVLTIDGTVDQARTKIARAAGGSTTLARRSQLQQGILSTSVPDRDGTRFWSLAFVKQTMGSHSRRLIGPADRFVVDRTGLQGEFDFVLEYDDSGVARPTVFTAVREQLGLRLRPAQVPVDVVTVGAVERLTGN